MSEYLRYLEFVDREKSRLERRGAGATYKWGPDDTEDIQQLEPKLKLVKEISMHELVGFPSSRYGSDPLPHPGSQPTLRRVERMVVYRY